MVLPHASERNRDQLLAILRNHEPELRAAGIEHLSLFGSVARNDRNPTSDVDLAANFSRSELLSLFALASLQGSLSDLLGKQVDLSERQYLLPAVRTSFERECILVY